MLKTVKDLKEVLANVPDNVKIVLSNPQWKRSEFLGWQFVEKSLADNNEPVLFLDTKNFK
jgi:hypothetical protein